MTAVMLLTVLKVFNSLLSFLFIVVNADIPKCKINGSKLVGETCFQFYASRLSWHDAKSNCESNGMILAYVISFNQSEEIFKDITIDGEVWIGASDGLKEGKFVWAASNESATELNQLWRKGEPNNINHGFIDEDCVGINSVFKANDIPCNISYPYLCMEQSCPYSLMVSQVFDQKVTLSWKPGFNGGQVQTFTVKYHDLTTNVSRVVSNVTAARTQQTSSLPIEYSVSGLSTKTPYQIYVEASINKGRIPCTVSVTAKTTGLQNNPLPPGFIFLFIFVPLMFAVGVAGFVYYRYKAKRTLVIERTNAYDSPTTDIKLMDDGQGTAFVYTAPTGLSAAPAALTAEQDTAEHDYEPMNSDPIYNNTSYMTRIVSTKSS